MLEIKACLPTYTDQHVASSTASLPHAQIYARGFRGAAARPAPGSSAANSPRVRARSARYRPPSACSTDSNYSVVARGRPGKARGRAQAAAYDDGGQPIYSTFRPETANAATATDSELEGVALVLVNVQVFHTLWLVRFCTKIS